MGENDYRRGARDRLSEAYVLLQHEDFGGSAYLAGRGVEGEMRAVIWMADIDVRQGRKSLDTGHDLRQLLTAIESFGLLRTDGHDEPLIRSVQHVARLWYNNMRFASAKSIETRWHRIGEISGKRSFKRASYDFYNACATVIRQCEVICQSLTSKTR